MKIMNAEKAGIPPKKATPQANEQPSTASEPPPETPKVEKKPSQVLTYVVLPLAYMAIGAFGFWLYQSKTSKPSTIQTPPSQVSTETYKSSPQTTQLPQTKTSYETITKANAQDESQTDVYIKNLDTGEETFLMTLADVYRQHAHNSEYHNGNLYIIRRIGHDGYPDNDWSDELWQYDSNRNGKKLFSSQGLYFLVSPNEQMIGIRSSEKVFFIDTEGKPIRQFSSAELDADPNDMANGLDILEWSSDSRNLWGWHAFGPVPASFYEIDTNTWEARKYDVSALNLGTEVDLNTETRKIVYSNYPALFDADSARDFEASGKKVTLYLYDFVTKENKEIATSVAKRFKPEWVDTTSFEYDNPNGEGRLVSSL